MRRIRSKPLWQYLESTGALASGDEAIIEAAKRAYRKQYKAEWKKNRPVPKKELRPAFTEKEFKLITYKAKINGYKNATQYLSETVRALLNDNTIVIPHKEQLLQILQLVSMAHIVVDELRFQYALYSQLQQVDTYLKEAETNLTKYLNMA